VPDHHGAADEAGKLGPDVSEDRGTRDNCVVDAMDTDGGFRNWFAGVKQPSKCGLRLQATGGELHRRDLHDPGLARVETSGLGIDHDRVKGDQRDDAAPSRHLLIRRR
jgi:hypothetical protein